MNTDKRDQAKANIVWAIFLFTFFNLEPLVLCALACNENI